MQATEPKPEPSLEQKIEAAEAELARLKGVAEDADAEVNRTAKAYETHRSRETLVDAMLAKDIASDAHAAIKAFQTEVLTPLLVEREKQKFESEKAALLEGFDETKVAALQGRLHALLADFVSAFWGTAAELGQLLSWRAENMPQAAAHGITVEPLDLQTLIDSVYSELKPLEGGHGVQYQRLLELSRTPKGHLLAVHVVRPLDVEHRVASREGMADLVQHAEAARRKREALAAGRTYSHDGPRRKVFDTLTGEVTSYGEAAE